MQLATENKPDLLPYSGARTPPQHNVPDEELNRQELGRYFAASPDNPLYRDYLEQEDETGILKFKGQKMPAALIEQIWEAFVKFDLLQRRRDHFTHYYYTSGLYREDYEEIVGKKFSAIYEVQSSSPDREKLKQRINLRFAEWKKLKAVLQQVEPVQPE